jgi:hypothetical protein
MLKKLVFRWFGWRPKFRSRSKRLPLLTAIVGCRSSGACTATGAAGDCQHCDIVCDLQLE